MPPFLLESVSLQRNGCVVRVVVNVQGSLLMVALSVVVNDLLRLVEVIV